MYICLCHGFTDKQVKSAVADGRRTLAEVYTYLGGRPRCGKCVAEVRALMPCSGSAETGAGRSVRAPQTE